jgi:heme/copper-type cytochrome/quinol oxidase subunit 4
MSDWRDQDDVAPGFLEEAERTVWQGVQGYLIGLVLATALTAASFYVVGALDLGAWDPGRRLYASRP